MDDRTQTETPDPAASMDVSKKRLKKRAKREARAMHALDQARRDLQKAERRLVRAQQELLQRQVDVETCLVKLGKIRARATFTEIPVTPEPEESIVLHIIETEDAEIPDDLQEFAAQVENLDQLLGSNEPLTFNLNETNAPASETHAEEPVSEPSSTGEPTPDMHSAAEPTSETNSAAESASETSNEGGPAQQDFREGSENLESTPGLAPGTENPASQDIASLEKALEEAALGKTLDEDAPTEPDPSETTIRRTRSYFNRSKSNNADKNPQ